jgi:hypothetical protein
VSTKRKAGGDDDSAMSAAEKARLRHRDRKRTTRMVVDNAAVKRVLSALEERKADRDRPSRD